MDTSDTTSTRDMSVPLGQQAASDDSDCVDGLDPSTHPKRIKLLTAHVEKQRRYISELSRQLNNSNRLIIVQQGVIEQLKSEISLHKKGPANITTKEGVDKAWRIWIDELAKNFDGFSQSDKLVRLRADKLADVLRRDDLYCSSEGVVLDALLRWIQSDEDSRKGDLLRLLELVRLEYVDLDRLGALLMRYEDSPADEQVTRLVQRVINNRSQPDRYPIKEVQPRTGIARKKQQEAGLTGQSLATVKSATQKREVIVVVGGILAGTEYANFVEYFDPVGHTWNRLPQMITSRLHPRVVTLNNTLYAIGGRDGLRDNLNSVEVYYPLVETWAKITPMAHPRSGHSATVHNGCIYVAGGALLSSAEKYDPVAKKWTPLASMRMPRNGHSLTSLGSYLYAIGGVGREQHTSLERYDPFADKWTLFEDVAIFARGHVALPFKKKMDGQQQQQQQQQQGIYLIGGQEDCRPCENGNSVQRLIIRGSGERPSDFVLEACSSLNSARSNFSATISGDTMYVIGGVSVLDGHECLDTMETIPLGNMSSGWTLHATKMSQGRSCHGSSTLRLK